MSKLEEYDVLVLGSGAPGKLLAWTLASQGKRTAVALFGSLKNMAKRLVESLRNLVWPEDA